MATEYPRLKLIAGPRAKDTRVIDLDTGAEIPVQTVALTIDVRTGAVRLAMEAVRVSAEFEGPGRVVQVCPGCRHEVRGRRGFWAAVRRFFAGPGRSTLPPPPERCASAMMRRLG